MHALMDSVPDDEHLGDVIERCDALFVAQNEGGERILSYRSFIELLTTEPWSMLLWQRIFDKLEGTSGLIEAATASPSASGLTAKRVTEPPSPLAPMPPTPIAANMPTHKAAWSGVFRKGLRLRQEAAVNAALAHDRALESAREAAQDEQAAAEAS